MDGSPSIWPKIGVPMALLTFDYTSSININFFWEEISKNIKVKAKIDLYKEIWLFCSNIFTFNVVSFTVFSWAPSSSFQHNFVYIPSICNQAGWGNMEQGRRNIFYQSPKWSTNPIAVMGYVIRGLYYYYEPYYSNGVPFVIKSLHSDILYQFFSFPQW